MKEGELVLEEAKVTVFAKVFTGKGVSANYTDFRHHVGDLTHGSAGEACNVCVAGCGRAGNSHLAGELQLSGIDEVADSCKVQKGYRPHGLTLHDGGDVAYLDTHVSCRMGTAHLMESNVLKLVERR